MPWATKHDIKKVVEEQIYVVVMKEMEIQDKI